MIRGRTGVKNDYYRKFWSEVKELFKGSGFFDSEPISQRICLLSERMTLCPMAR